MAYNYCGSGVPLGQGGRTVREEALWRIEQIAKALITLMTLAAFVGIHLAMHWLIGLVLISYPTAMKILESAQVVAFLTVGVILLVEFVEVFAPWARAVPTTPTAAADEE